MSNLHSSSSDQRMQFIYDVEDDQSRREILQFLGDHEYSSSSCTKLSQSQSLSQSKSQSLRQRQSQSQSHCTASSCSGNTNNTTTPRRRSRASRKAPTTLLNANTTNFRDLVQQFTGFHASSSSSNNYSNNIALLGLELGSRRGPVNLSFGAQDGEDQVTAHEYNHQHDQLRSSAVVQQDRQRVYNTARNSSGSSRNNGENVLLSSSWEWVASTSSTIVTDHHQYNYTPPSDAVAAAADQYMELETGNEKINIIEGDDHNNGRRMMFMDDYVDEDFTLRELAVGDLIF